MKGLDSLVHAAMDNLAMREAEGALTVVVVGQVDDRGLHVRHLRTVLYQQLEVPLT